MQNPSVLKKLASLFISSVLALSALVGAQTAANAAAPGQNISPIAITSGVSQVSTGNGSNEYWFMYSATAAGTITVNTCTQTGASSVGLVAYESALNNITDQTTAVWTGLPASEPSTCSNGFVKRFTVQNGKYYYIRVTSAGNHSITSTLTFTAGGGGGNNPTYTELDRVTICHRTHSTTNPYVFITIAASAIVKGDSTKNGHGWHNPDKNRYDTSLYGAYDSTKTYRGNTKLWGDIIPPFKDKTTGGIFTGLNWDSAWSAPTATTQSSGAVFTKASFRTATTGGTNPKQSAVDACKGTDTTLDAQTNEQILKKLFDIERKAGQKRDDILDEIAEDEGKSKDTLKSELTLPAKEGPKNLPTNQIAQSLSGVVWLDINRNGFQEDNEPYMSNIKVTVTKGSSGIASGAAPLAGFGAGARVLGDKFGANAITSVLDFGLNQIASAVSGLRSILGMATTYVVYTDKNGYYIFKSLESGDWYATGVVPAGLDVTYDSSSINDATVDAIVPAGGHAQTWIGLMGSESTGVNAPVKNPDGTPVTKEVVITAAGPDGKFCTADDVNYVITPSNGTITLSGIAAGAYYVRQIGSTATIADFTIVSGQTYTTAISAKAGTRCAVLSDSLANTGAQDSKPLGLIALVLVLFGGVTYRVAARRS